MSATFAGAARQLAGFAGLLLGWRPDEFWRATPAELAAVLSPMAADVRICATGKDLERLMEMFPDG